MQVDLDHTALTRSMPADLLLTTTGSAGQETMGKHRITAEVKRLEQETRFLEQELEELERIEKASMACEELVHCIESSPDPLLPVTNGPGNPSWDRWFEAPRDTQRCGSCGCGCSIL